MADAGVRRRRRVALAAAGLALLALLLLGPALWPGYVLSYDMVFVPRQSLLPASLGLGGGLPRAVPQDAVLAALTTLLPGSVWQHLALAGIAAGGAWGAARLARGRPWWQAAATATLFVWSAYLVERLVLGAWALLVAYAVLPWALSAALAVRRARPGAVAALLLWTALASLVPTGGLLVAGVAVPVAVGPGSRPSPWRRVGLGAGALALQAPWLVPALLHPAAGAADPDGSTAFALRVEGPWGALVTALGTGGVWNADAVPATRGTFLAPLAALVVVALAVAGWRPATGLIGRSGRAWLATTAVAGLLWAVATAWSPTRDATAWLAATLPGGGLLRDAQKWLAPWALLLAVLAPAGLARLLARMRERTGRVALGVGLVLLPIALLPDAAWGVSGRLQSVDYPPAWAEVRAYLAAPDAGGGDVVVLPWSAFRAFGWNGRRTSLDPAPRWLPRPSVADDTLLVGRPGGEVLVVSGEDPRAAAVSAALADRRPLADVLPGLGVGWVLVEGDTPGRVDGAALAGYRPVLVTGSLTLLAGPAAGPAPPPGSVRVAAVVAADVVALLVLVGAVAGRVATLRRSARRAGAPAATVGGTGSEEGS